MACTVFLRLAVRNRWRNPRRGLIAVAAVTVGIAGLVFLFETCCPAGQGKE